MKVLLRCTLLAGLAALGFMGCNPNSIGRVCVNPTGEDVKGTQVSSPALECPSRLCLLQPVPKDGSRKEPRAICTAKCESDGDCDPETMAECPESFVCAVATTTGPFCCQKMCICKTDLQVNKNRDEAGNVKTPPACDPGINANITVTCPSFNKEN